MNESATKKILSVFLAVIMCVMSFPTSILAKDTQTITEKIEGGLTISATGTFPQGTELSVVSADKKTKQKTEKQIEKIREDNLIKSETWDIKLMSDGKEWEPTSDVKLEFKYDKIDENLNATVYHTHDKTEKLKTKVNGDTISTTTDGFSLFTVEFTYEDKEFSIEGESSVKLSKILKEVGITGEVSSYAVSDKKLFDVVKGDEDGVEYKESYDEHGNLTEYYPVDKKKGELYLVSLKPFTTEEWLKVTVNDIEYKITVTDAIRVNEDGEQVDSVARYMGANGSGTGVTRGTNNTITDTRVIQGPTEDNFTATMPLAEIYIDDTFVNTSLWKTDEVDGNRIVGDIVKAELLVNSTQDDGKYAGFELNTNPASTSPAAMGSLKSSYGGLTYNFANRYLNDTRTLTVGSVAANRKNYELFPGDIVKYTIKGAATKFDVNANEYKKYDVVITYSDILLTICQNSNNQDVDQSVLSTAHATLLDTNMVFPSIQGSSTTFRLGMSYNVNVKVVDPNNNNSLVQGSYYYPMVDVDVGRTGIGGFANLYNAANVNRYSEQVALLGNYGRPTSSGSWEQKIWIPGGNWADTQVVTMANITDEAFPYTSKITSATIDNTTNALLIQPGNTDGSVTKVISNARFGTTAPNGDNHPNSHNNSFYSGFITLANNTAGGIKAKGWGSAQGSAGMESYILTGSQIVNHKVDSSSNVGGTIFTTTTGNSDGKLSGGTLLGYDEINKPFELSAATGQSVTYTMTPKGGYKLKKVWVKDTDTDVMTIVNNAKDSINKNDFDSNNDGELNDSERTEYENAIDNAVNNALTNGNATEIPISSLKSLGKGVYTYTFSGITEDKSIHIEWEKTNLTVKKEISPQVSTTDKFKFQIKLSDTSTEETVWRVRAKKNTNKFKIDTNVEDGEPFYLVYYQTKDKTVPYKYVQVTDTTDKNPKAEGWFYYQDGVYSPANETTVIPDRTYYYKDEEQTSTIKEYYYHVLGWDDTTKSWKSHVIPATNDEYSGAVLGATNLDNTLDDSYRFLKKDNYVYNKAIYDSESDSNDYLLWVRDSSITSGTYDQMVIGKLTDYPSGTMGGAIQTNGSYTYVYMPDSQNPDFQGKVFYTQNNASYIIDGTWYNAANVGETYVNVQDEQTPIYYDLASNPNSYTLNSGYSPLEGESGVYTVTLPAGETPNTADLVSDGWEVNVSRVGAVVDDFDLDAAMTAAGAKAVLGAVNTFEFELGAGESIDFNGVVPMGYNYEITEILPQTSKWRIVSQSSNATMNNFDGDEDVTFTNAEKKYNLTIEKQTQGNVAGTFDFTVNIFKEEVTKGQHQTISIQAYKNSGDNSVTYKLVNDGIPVLIDINGVSAVIPSGEYIKGTGTPLDAVISNLVAANNSANVPIAMNNVSGELSTATDVSIADQVQSMVNGEVTSFFLEPVEFILRTPDIVNRVPYAPNTVPAGFNGSNGTFTFTLNNGATKVFTDIPMGYKYEITETLPVGWENVSKTNESGTMTDDITSVWTNKQGEYDLTVEKDVLGSEGGTFDFDIKVWKDVPDYGEAYAVFDSADGSLTFFRDNEGKYTQGQTDGTKTYYTGIETTNYTNYSQLPWHSNRANVQSVIFQDPIKPVSTAGWFYFMSNPNFTSISGLEKLDTSNVTNMSYMFSLCQRLTTLDLSHFDTSKVTNTREMFSSCSRLTSIDLSHFDTSNVTDMRCMFLYCTSLTSLDVSHFNTSKVTDMAGMFYRCQSLTSLDLSHFDTSNVTDMNVMFYYCPELTTTLNIMNMPSNYSEMCEDAATATGAQITLKYIDPVTSANIDTLVAEKSSESNVINGGQGTFTPPDTSGVWNENNPTPTPVSMNQLGTKPEYLDLTSKGGTSNGDGAYKFTISSGSSKVLSDIPAGYKYEVTERNKTGWKLHSSSNESGTITKDTTATFVNEPLISISVYKEWEDNNKPHTASDITSALTLFQNGTGTVAYNNNITVTDFGGGRWEYRVTGLPKYDSNGDPYTYRVVETNVPTNYEVSYSNPQSAIGNVKAAANGDTITNTALKNLTIKKETLGNESGEFEYEIKLWKDIPPKYMYNIINAEDLASKDLFEVYAEYTRPTISEKIDVVPIVGEINDTNFTDASGTSHGRYYIQVTDWSYPYRLIDGSIYDVSDESPRLIDTTNQEVGYSFDGQNRHQRNYVMDGNRVIVKEDNEWRSHLNGWYFELLDSDLDWDIFDNYDEIQFPQNDYGLETAYKLNHNAIINGRLYPLLSEETFLPDRSMSYGVYIITPDKLYSDEYYASIFQDGYTKGFHLTSEQGFTPKTDANNDGIADDGVYTFTLENGESLTIPNIPIGYQYTITEKDKTGWRNVSSTNASGTLNDNTTSTWVNEKLSKLTVKKNVKGNLGDKTKNFSFTANLTGLTAGETYSHSDGTFTADTNGEASVTFNLKDDEEWSLNDLPYNTNAVVTETASNHTASYEVKQESSVISSNANTEKETSLATSSVQVKKDTVVEFTNTRGVEPITTAASAMWWLYILVLLLMVEMYVEEKYRRRFIARLTD